MLVPLTIESGSPKREQHVRFDTAGLAHRIAGSLHKLGWIPRYLSRLQGATRPVVRDGKAYMSPARPASGLDNERQRRHLTVGRPPQCWHRSTTSSTSARGKSGSCIGRAGGPHVESHESLKYRVRRGKLAMCGFEIDRVRMRWS